jgi:hypothetical protein
MVEKPARFQRTIFQAECIVHNQNDIDIIRLHLRGNVASEKHEPAHALSAFRELVNVGQVSRASVTLASSAAEAPEDLTQRGPMDAGRQITGCVGIW